MNKTITELLHHQDQKWKIPLTAAVEAQRVLDELAYDIIPPMIFSRKGVHNTVILQWDNKFKGMTLFIRSYSESENIFRYVLYKNINDYTYLMKGHDYMLDPINDVELRKRLQWVNGDIELGISKNDTMMIRTDS